MQEFLRVWKDSGTVQRVSKFIGPGRWFAITISRASKKQSRALRRRRRGGTVVGVRVGVGGRHFETFNAVAARVFIYQKREV